MARTASTRSPLVPILTLLVGLAAGWATNPFGGESARAGAPLRAAATAPSADASRAGEVDAALREEDAVQARVEAQAAASASASAVEAPQEPSGEPAPASLLAELSLLLRSGRIETALSQDAQRLLRFAVEAWLTAGEPREALALLDRHPELESHQYGRVGHMLLNAQDRGIIVHQLHA